MPRALQFCSRRPLVTILVVGAVLRIALLASTPHFVMFGDAADYQRHGVSIAAGLGYPPTEVASPGTPSAFRPPAYPFLLGGVYAVSGDSVKVGPAWGLARRGAHRPFFISPARRLEPARRSHRRADRCLLPAIYWVERVVVVRDALLARRAGNVRGAWRRIALSRETPLVGSRRRPMCRSRPHSGGG